MDKVEKRVGIADLNIVLPPGRLITIGLGSCIGIALYDEYKKVAGLAHIMLPESANFNNVTVPYKFADLAIPLLVEKMEGAGCRRRCLKAKIAGGASMFNFADKSMISDIGKRNSEAVKKALEKMDIPILAEEIGGNKGRTMVIDSQNGEVSIKIVGKDAFIL